MRKFFYSISIFSFLCLLSLGYYHSYQLAGRRSDDIRTEINEPAKSVIRQENGGYGLFYLKEQNGYVTVYEKDRETLYEPTSIAIEALPEALQSEIRHGKYLKTHEELYSFLENYSS